MKNLFLLSFLFLLLACSKDSAESLPLSPSLPEKGVLTPYFTDEIDYAKALQIAQQAPARFGGEFTKGFTKTVLSGEPIVSQGSLTKSGNASIDTLMYVFNYVEGGYAVVPTLEVESDLIAYIEEGTFNIQDTLTDDLSRFLVSMMMDYQKSVVIKYKQDTLATKSELVRPSGRSEGPMCTRIEISANRFYDFGDPVYPPSEAERDGAKYYKTKGCYMPMRSVSSSYKYKEPLLTTTWGQGDPYNAQAKKIKGEYAKAGCVAIAVSQIMVYNEHPTTFPSSMLSLPLTAEFQGYVGKPTRLSAMKKIKDLTIENTSAARDNVSRFIAMIGYMLKNDWGVESTGADSDDVPKVFNNMGYGVGPLIPYNGTKTEASLNCSQPVYIRGWRTLTTGHAWVVDGYKIENYQETEYIYYFDANCGYNGRMPTNNGVSIRHIYFHHNFGWSGGANGYYLDGVFDTSRRQEATGGEIDGSKKYEKIQIIPTIVKI